MMPLVLPKAGSILTLMQATLMNPWDTITT